MLPAEKRAGLSRMEQDFKGYKQYNFSTWKLTKPVEVRISYGQQLDAMIIAKLYWYRLFNYDQFKNLAKVLVSISYK